MLSIHCRLLAATTSIVFRKKKCVSFKPSIHLRPSAVQEGGKRDGPESTTGEQEHEANKMIGKAKQKIKQKTDQCQADTVQTGNTN